MTDTIEDLSSLYDVQMTERERASLESQIWELVPSGKRPKGGIGAYFNQQFGVTNSSCRHRHQLHLAGDDANPLWAKLESGMPLRTAVLILRQAQSSSRKTRFPLHEEVERQLHRYESMGVQVKTTNGKVFRRSKAGSTHRDPIPSQLEVETKKAVDVKNFWMAMRSMVASYINTKLDGYDSMEIDSVRRRVEADLNVFLTDMQDIIRRAPKGRIELVGVTRRQVIDACRALGMDPPPPGKPVDEKKAKLQRKLYSRQYHPDVHGGSEETRHLFQAAIEGFKIIERYNQELNPSTVGDE